MGDASPSRRLMGDASPSKTLRTIYTIQRTAAQDHACVGQQHSKTHTTAHTDNSEQRSVDHTDMCLAVAQQEMQTTASQGV
jgi:hypothetical protein